MSSHSFTIIEQLDLVSKELRRSNPLRSRFALILIDNVVELILHRACTQEISRDNLWIKLGKPKYSSKDRSDAMGKIFDRKVNFLVRLNKIARAEAEFIKICHKYRNELYHTGLKYELILWDLSMDYYEIALALLQNVNPNDFYSSGVVTTRIVKKHTGNRPFRVIDDVGFICKSLRGTLPSRSTTLACILSESAVNRVKAIREDLHFLLANDPEERTERTTLYELQLYDYLNSEDALVEAVLKKARTQSQRVAAVNYLGTVWQPRYATNPLTSFLKKAEKIASSSSPLTALSAFEIFRGEIAYIARLIDEAASALDESIQVAIDLARGK